MPKDVDVLYSDENGNPAELKSYHFENENDEQGWYYFDGEPYLTKTALKKELKLKIEQLTQVINLEDGIKCRTETNEYRSFVVYCLEDVKELMKRSSYL
jgi:hypothetical protein